MTELGDDAEAAHNMTQASLQVTKYSVKCISVLNLSGATDCAKIFTICHLGALYHSIVISKCICIAFSNTYISKRVVAIIRPTVIELY
jgi:hypothetical protein